MAYDDEPLCLNGDTYRRHEGVLTVMPSCWIGAEDYLTYSPVDFFEDLVKCFDNFNTQFQQEMEDCRVEFNPKYTVPDWIKICNLALHETVNIDKSISDDEKIQFDEFQNMVMIERQNNLFYFGFDNTERCFNNFKDLNNFLFHHYYDVGDNQIYMLYNKFSSEILSKLNNACKYIEKIDFAIINNVELSLISKNQHYLQKNDLTMFIKEIGIRNFRFILDGPLIENWFDDSYKPVTRVEVPLLGLFLSYNYEFNVIDFYFRHPQHYFGMIGTADNLVMIIDNCDDFNEIIDNLISHIHKAWRIRFKEIKLKQIESWINSNKKIIKAALTSLLELNYTKPQTHSCGIYYSIKTRIKGNFRLKEDNLIDMITLSNLKDFDIRSPYVSLIVMQCKIKNLKAPTLQVKSSNYVNKNDYTQTCIVYDENTNKTLKALLLNSCADFDKYENVTDVEIVATWDLREKRPLLIREMNPIEKSAPEKITNRFTENPEYGNWRDQVIKRDKFCQCCGYDNIENLEVHHDFGYKEYPELATDINNGIVLCKWCHDKYHSIYGLKNINPRDLVEFIKNHAVR